MPIDTHREMLEDLKHCPENLPGNAIQRAQLAEADIRKLAMDVRELDPEQIWGRINRWCHNNPARVYAALVAASTHLDPDTLPARGEAAWTHGIGGAKALHPDHLKTRTAEYKKYIERNAHTDEWIALRRAGLSYPEIARRTGASESAIYRACRKAGLTVNNQNPDPAGEAAIKRLLDNGVSIPLIAHKLGLNRRTVTRIRARLNGQVVEQAQEVAA